MAPDAVSTTPVQYSYIVSEKALEDLSNRKIIPESIFKTVFLALPKISYGPTPEYNKEVEPLIEGSNDMFRLKINEQFALHYRVIENEKKFLVFWVGRFN